jgi:hypothetical protein
MACQLEKPGRKNRDSQRVSAGTYDDSNRSCNAKRVDCPGFSYRPVSLYVSFFFAASISVG